MDQTNEIGEIPYPDEHVEELKRVIPLLVESMERNGLPIDSGIINIRNIDDGLGLPLFFFHWIVESNGVIQNLNIVISDLRDLPHKYALLSGSPRLRYYLLVRTYFYEFYRFREIFNQAVRALQVGGYLKKSEVPEIRKTFHEAFEHTIEIRNAMVHGSFIWKGEKHFNLNVVGGAMELGRGLKSEDTGEV